LSRENAKASNPRTGGSRANIASVNFQYIRRGKGPVLVLQHGFLSGSAYWQKQIDFFSRNFDVIAPTLPGFADHPCEGTAEGESRTIHTVSGYVHYLIALLDQVNVLHFHLLGHSMGGMIAQEAALEFGHRIDKLVLYGTGPDGALPGRFEPIAASRQRVIREGPRSTLARTVASWFVSGDRDPSYPHCIELAAAASVPAILGGYDAMATWSSAERLHRIGNPTLVIWGTRDRSYHRNQADQLVHGIAGAELAVIENCGHNVHLEKPDRFNQHVFTFLGRD